MLPDPRARSRLPQPGTTRGVPVHRGLAPLDYPLAREPAAADAAIPFSRVAEELRVSAAAIDVLVEDLPVGVLVVDRDGRVMYTNESARAMRIERLEAIQWVVTRALLTEDAVREEELEVVTPGAPRRWLSAHAIPVRAPGRGVTGALVTVADVTARMRMRAWNPVIETLVNL